MASGSWPTLLFAGSLLAALLVGGTIIWLQPVEPAAVLALLASVPFLILARVAWRSRSKPG